MFAGLNHNPRVLDRNSLCAPAHSMGILLSRLVPTRLILELPKLPPSPLTTTPPSSPVNCIPQPPNPSEWFPLLEEKLRALSPGWEVVPDLPRS